MRFSAILNAIGALLIALAGSMGLALAVSLVEHDGMLFSWLGSIGLTLVSGAVLFYATHGEQGELKRSEGFAVVTFGWIAASIFGCLPFLLSRQIPSLTDAFFETMSGFTTTGASVLAEVETLAPSMLFWRSMTHWVGGMGIIVLSLAILPFLGIGGMQLYRAEVPGPAPDRLRPRIRETAKLLWGVYFALTIAMTGLLLSAGMPLLDAACHAFGTLGTGGFSTRNGSIGAYNSAYIDWIVIIFMFLAGANFTLHYRAILRRSFKPFRDPEFVFYGAVLICAVAFLTLSLSADGAAQNQPGTLRAATFQVVSLATSTGYATANYEIWPAHAQFLLLMLMVMGGCAGSTGGGVKVVRIMLIIQHIRTEFRRLLHPRAVLSVKHGGERIADSVIHHVLGFALLYCTLFAGIAFTLCVIEQTDLVTAASATIACLSNIGPGLGSVGPTDNYSWMNAGAKWLLSLSMLLGRLEIYTVLVLFSRDTWRR